MSYMRVKYYLWKDDALMHIWARNGYDYWDESFWYQDDKQESSDAQPSGVAFPVMVQPGAKADYVDDSGGIPPPPGRPGFN